jgi:NitT/TauT family transport system permease protein
MARSAGRLAPVLLLLVVWEAATRSRLVDPSFLPTVTSVLAALWDLLRGGEIPDNLSVSIFRTVSGLALAGVVGVLLGVAMAMSRAADGFFGPLVAVTYSLPKSGLVPLLLLWFGIGNATDITAVFLACLLPILVHAYHGVKGAPAVLLWSARAMGTPRRALVTRVLLPAALPSILTGGRIALGFAFVLTISAEMIASTDGIGKLIFMYGENGAYPHMFAAIAVVVTLSFLADRGFLALTRYLLRWHEFTQERDGAAA